MKWGDHLSIMLNRWVFIGLFLYGWHNGWPDVWLVGFMVCWTILWGVGYVLLLVREKVDG